MRYSPPKALAILLLLAAFPAYAQAGKLESIGAFSGASASDAMKKALEPRGWRVSLPDGAVLCEIWLRRNVTTGKNEAQGASYTSLLDSTFIGVITFPKPATDFRKQPIQPGTYTLRYSLHPIDGNHMGISPIRDFLLLSPIAADLNPDAKYKFADLVELSKKAAGVNHPAPISLVSPEGINNWPSLSEDEYGHLVFAAKVKTDSGRDLPIAFVVRGAAEQEG
jgi:hypothetical protein